MNERIYLDHNAATPPDPRVVQALHCFLMEHAGNPSSVHSYGRSCKAALSRSCDLIAGYLGVRPEEILFTSGGTEGANLVIRGLFQQPPQGHIITSSVEHSCVYETVKHLESIGCTATYLPVGEWGAVKPEEVEKHVRPDTKLIAVMAVNNETGVKSDVEEIAVIAKKHGIPYFVDAVSLLGKEKFQIPEGVSAMCFSGQKMHAVQGIGFCYVSRRLKLTPLITGGGHQWGRRAGTENLPGIVALAKAISLLEDELPQATEKMRRQRDGFELSLKKQLGNIEINGLGPRVVNTSNIYFPSIDGETLLTALDMEGVAVSHGSACASGALEPSRILLNMGLSLQRVNHSIRFSLSRFTTDEEVERAVEIIVRLVRGIV